MDMTYVVRLWTPVEVDMVEEKLRLLVWMMLLLVMLKEVVKEVGLNSGVVTLRLRGAELISARERRNADMFERRG